MKDLSNVPLVTKIPWHAKPGTPFKWQDAVPEEPVADTETEAVADEGPE